MKDIKVFFEQDNVKQRFAEMLGKRAPQFITSVLQITASNDLLAKADPLSVYNAAAVAATLDLPLNNNLGFAYIVPYNQKYKDGNEWKTKSVAQFQLGYKGFTQLALRSGQFHRISTAAIYEGQLVAENPLTGYEFDFTKKSDKVIGYAAYFKLVNGFEAINYMTVEQLKGHGLKYSKTFKAGGGLWESDFDKMAKKTVLKLLLSRSAPLSIDMQTAVASDQSVVNNHETLDVTYVDSTSQELEPINKEHERMSALIAQCKDLELLESYYPEIELLDSNEIMEAYLTKKSDLTPKKNAA